MNVNSILKSEGIIVKSKLDKRQVHKISSVISKSICKAFPEQNLNRNNVYNCLSSINMYIADFNTTDSMAKYFSKTNAIYFNSAMDFSNLDTLVIHECLHALQEIKNNNGKIIRLGLFDIQKNAGEGINEAAVQLMSSKITHSEFESVKYYDLNFSTSSPIFYPIETALINQIAYFTGSYALYHSTLYGDEVFKNTLIAKIGESDYKKIERNFDLLIKAETALSICSGEMAKCKNTSLKYQKLLNNIEQAKKRIINLTFSTQNLIMSSCFFSELNLVKNQDSLDELQNKLIDFEKLIISNSTYTDYANFCENMIDKCLAKSRIIKEIGSLNYSTSLELELIALEKNFCNLSFFKKAFIKLKLLYEAKIYEKE